MKVISYIIHVYVPGEWLREKTRLWVRESFIWLFSYSWSGGCTTLCWFLYHKNFVLYTTIFMNCNFFIFYFILSRAQKLDGVQNFHDYNICTPMMQQVCILFSSSWYIDNNYSFNIMFPSQTNSNQLTRRRWRWPCPPLCNEALRKCFLHFWCSELCHTGSFQHTENLCQTLRSDRHAGLQNTQQGRGCFHAMLVTHFLAYFL